MNEKYATNNSVGGAVSALWIAVCVLTIALIYQRTLSTTQQKKLSEAEALYLSSWAQHEDRLLALEHKMDREEGLSDILIEAVHGDRRTRAKVKKVRELIIDAFPKKNHPNGCSIITPGRANIQADAVVTMSERYGLDTALLLALGRRESLFCNTAVSHANAYGWGQIIPQTAVETARKLQRRNLRLDRVRDNIELAAAYLSEQLINFDGNIRLALAAYNAGPAYVLRVQEGRIAEYPLETQEYIVAVLAYRDTYRKVGL